MELCKFNNVITASLNSINKRLSVGTHKFDVALATADYLGNMKVTVVSDIKSYGQEKFAMFRLSFMQ